MKIEPVGKSHCTQVEATGRSRIRSTRASLPFASLVALASAIGVVAGCGGHHASIGSGSSSSTESTGRDSCSLTKYAPNYGSGITLTYWPQFPLHVYFDTTSESYTTDLQSRAVTAFNGWVANTGGEVAYDVVTDPTQADITVGFVSIDSSLLSSYDADGITYYYAGTTAAGATADQLAESVKLYVGIDGTTLRENGTMGHEFGHALGIHGHSPVDTDIMYYRWTATRSQTPTTRDINTLDTAYCGDFSRAEPVRSVAAAPTRPLAPPLTAPGWMAIP